MGLAMKFITKLLLLAPCFLLAGCGSAGLEVRSSGVASLKQSDGCSSAEPVGDLWGVSRYCSIGSNRDLGVLAARSIEGFSPQGLALLAEPDSELKVFLGDGKSFTVKTDAKGFVAFEVKSKSPIAYFLIRYSPKEQLKCDAEVGGPVCEPVLRAYER
jgi:hypothetical protein